MKKIGIISCLEVSKRCSGSGCINAFDGKRGSFDRYAFKDADIVDFVLCHGCGDDATEGVVREANKLKDKGVETIHLSTCIRSKCNWYQEFINELSTDFEVVDFTHGKKK